MNYPVRILRSMFGSVVFAFGTVIIMDSNIGYGPWDVLHAGISLITSITIGQASIVIGCLLIAINIAVKEPIGLSTALSMLMMGIFVDLFRLIPGRPTFDPYILRVAYMLLGLFICALGTYFYTSAGLGTGPRDGIMVSIRRHTKIPVGVARFLLEMTAALVGCLLGSPIGIGTVLYAFGLGLAIQVVFTLFRFDPAKLKHETLRDTWRCIRDRLRTKN